MESGKWAVSLMCGFISCLEEFTGILDKSESGDEDVEKRIIDGFLKKLEEFSRENK